MIGYYISVGIVVALCVFAMIAIIKSGMLRCEDRVVSVIGIITFVALLIVGILIVYRCFNKTESEEQEKEYDTYNAVVYEYVNCDNGNNYILTNNSVIKYDIENYNPRNMYIAVLNDNGTPMNGNDDTVVEIHIATNKYSELFG